MRKPIDFQAIDFYHGSPYRINRFSIDFCGHGNDQIGSGVYCTTSTGVAKGYCTAKPESLARFPELPVDPTLHKLRVPVKNPLDVTLVQTLSEYQVERIIAKSPVLEDALSSYGDIEYEGLGRVMRCAIKTYTGLDVPLIQTLHMLANDFFKGFVADFNQAVHQELGYDSAVQYFDNQIMISVWFPEEIEIIAHLDPAPSPCSDLDPF